MELEVQVKQIRDWADEAKFRGIGKHHLPPPDDEVDGGVLGLRDAESHQPGTQPQPTDCKASLVVLVTTKPRIPKDLADCPALSFVIWY